MMVILLWFVLVLKKRDLCIILLSCHYEHPAAAALAVIHGGNIGIPSQASPLVISSAARDLVSRFLRCASDPILRMGPHFLPSVEMTLPYLHVP